MTIFDPFEFTPGVRYRHNKTNAVFVLESVAQRSPTIEPVAKIRAADGRTFQVSPAQLREMYSEIDDDGFHVEPEPGADPGDGSARLPIGSVSIDAIDPEPGEFDASPELNFRRSGRPVKPISEIQSYFGTPQKYGPRKKENE